MLCSGFIIARHSTEMQNRTGFGIKVCLREPSLGWKCFGTYKSGREFYAFNDKYVRNFIRKSIKGAGVADLNRYFESNQCEEILNIIEKHK